jgi:glycosyltransferase involved in cell wall biosynthesis
MKVFHFTQAFGGGVATCMMDWVASTPNLEHVIYAKSEQFMQINQDFSPNFKFVAWNVGIMKTRKEIKKILEENEIDILHLHSSWAGLVRIFKWPVPVIYSPHCFAFERKGKFRLFNPIIYVVEKILTYKTDFFILVSNYERNLTLNLNKKAKHFVTHHTRNNWEASKPIAKLVSIGRICPQKNPKLIAKIGLKLKQKYPHLELVWIGDGDRKAKTKLLAVGYQVTGWVKPDEVQEYVKDSIFLLHAAKWEGNPVVFEEMRAGGIPVLAKAEAYLEEMLIDEGIVEYETIQDAVNKASVLLDLPKRIVRESIGFKTKKQTDPESLSLTSIYGGIAHGI